ncbi:MAG: threonine--tRNA ligase [Clostridiales bacterium]|nr:threonine--tRNA ligase [Clostridiales bacterium]
MNIHIQWKNRDKSMEFPQGTTLIAMAGELDRDLKKAALLGKVNGKVTELNEPVMEDGEVEIFTFEDEEGRDAYRHTCSHIMAQAALRLYPGTKLAIGPSIEDGFYYDFDPEKPFDPEAMEAISAEMGRIIKENIPLERFTMGREDALKFFRDKGETYKVELIGDLDEDAEISFYRQGDFTDLCAGPHVPSTGYIKAYKLMSLAGAYWRGSERNKMLQRIYATAFFSKQELQEHLDRIEEAKKRDHRKLGQELKLFTIKDEGPGFPFFYPKGMILRNELMAYWREVHRAWGYDEVSTPVILNRELWERSGHWFNYKDNMYTTVIDEEDYAIKPMNCPGSLLIYNSELHSYRDFPLRWGEMGLVHRHELSGALHGLMRVRCFTQDDAHLYMLPSQITEEVAGVVRLIDSIYKMFGFDYRLELSTMPEQHLGDEETWRMAEATLEDTLKSLGAEYAINPGDGAFYGPKIDFHLKDSLGRTWQCGTIQLDFQMPERFDLTYVGEDGQKHRPVMVHRTAYGSLERFIAILTEHFAAAFPTWLAPVQVKILPITDRQHKYADFLARELKAEGFRVEADLRSEKIGFKIREAQNERAPYMLVVGDKEQDMGAVALRIRGKGDKGTVNFLAFKRKLKEEVAGRSLELMEMDRDGK